MAFSHVPVLLEEALHWLALKPGGIYVDGTLGGGGHSEAILQAIGPKGCLYGLDRDADAIAAATARLSAYPAFHAIQGNFHDIKTLLAKENAPSLDGALLDLGVSSYQLDTPLRGFSYHEDAPLDMRMDQKSPMDAATLLNTAPEAEIARIIREYGEERWAARIAKILVERRQQSPLCTTGDLVSVVDAAIPKAVRQKDEGHPARRTFQAVRIAVNDELEPLRQALNDFADLLKPGGRLCVITFHSLEDRIVKNTFRTMQHPCECPPKAPICTCGKKPSGKVLAGGAVPPGKEEIASNPRSRSAKLRVVEKL